MTSDPTQTTQNHNEVEDWTGGFANPIERFADLFRRAQITEPFDHTAVVLATADNSGQPSARVVLLKGVDAQGFMFVTNYEGRKGQELQSNPKAALCFYYPTLNEQCRVEGLITLCSAEESDRYFATRPRTSQIGAWASSQSRPLSSRAMLMAEVERLTKQFEGQEIPRPPHWGGFRLQPLAIEFWHDGPFRLHDRFRYERPDTLKTDWTIQRLWP